MPKISPSGSFTPHIVVVGVSGSGKSTIGSVLAARLDRHFVEADDLHPPLNIADMTAGRPLTDEARLPWLRAIRARMDALRETGDAAVIACSGLRRAHRSILRGASDDAVFVAMQADLDTVVVRMAGRAHFMPPSLAQSQFAVFEDLGDDEPGVVVDATAPLDQVVARICDHLRLSRVLPANERHSPKQRSKT